MSWRCDCGAENFTKSQACEFCGREHVTPPTQPPTYREMKPRRWEDSRPSDKCPEEGCPFYVRDHIAQFREYGRRIQGRTIRL